MTDFREHCIEILFAIKMKYFLNSAEQILGFQKNYCSPQAGSMLH